jgi:hypothetical protein
MKWRKATERLPEATKPPYVVIVRWYENGEHLRIDTMTPNQLDDRNRWNVTMEYEWLDETPDESLPTDADLQAEAEKEYVAFRTANDGQVFVGQEFYEAGYMKAESRYAGRVRELEEYCKKANDLLDDFRSALPIKDDWSEAIEDLQLSSPVAL